MLPHRARQLSPESRRVIISMNPRAGSRARHDHLEAIVDGLRADRFTVQLTTDLGELEALTAAESAAGELRAVLALGGDGTASVVRNHVPLEVPLLAVPMGTENLLGRYVGQTADPAAVCQTVAEGVTIELDLGRAGEKYFLIMISAGFDAEVVRALHENRRGNIRRSAYLLPTLQAIRSYEYPPMQVYWETTVAPDMEPLSCRWMFGVNLPLYAFGLPIAPDAVATDGLLDVCTFEHGAMWGVARYLWHVLRRGHLELADTTLIRSPRLRLESESPKLAYQLDGDYGGRLPVDVEVLPGELRLLVPRQAAARLGFAVPAAAPRLT